MSSVNTTANTNSNIQVYNPNSFCLTTEIIESWTEHAAEVFLWRERNTDIVM